MGPGIKNVVFFNDASLAKWRWALFAREESLWVRVLDSKYEGWKGLVRALIAKHLYGGGICACLVEVDVIRLGDLNTS